MKKGFTLLELLVYVALLATVLASLLTFLLWVVKSQTKAGAMRDVLLSGQRAMDVISREVTFARTLYTPTSVFGISPGQLSLQTSKYIPQGETFSYIDFYLCEDQLCMKRESQAPLAITPDNVSVGSLLFTNIGNSSVRIVMTLGAKTLSPKPEYQASLQLTNTSTFRPYGQ